MTGLLLPADVFGTSPTGRTETATQRQQVRDGLEGTAVRTILRKFRLDVRDAEQRAQERVSTGNLSFPLFMELYPTFPAYLVFSRVWRISGFDNAALFKDFRKTPIWKAYQQALEQVRGCGWRGYTAMLFAWPEVAKYMVLHDVPLAAIRTHLRVCVGGKTTNHEFSLEPLPGFLESLTWVP